VARSEGTLPFVSRPTATPIPTVNVAAAVRSGVATALVAQNRIRALQATPTPHIPPNTAIDFTWNTTKLTNGSTLYSGRIQNKDKYWIVTDIDVLVDFLGENGQLSFEEHGIVGESTLAPGDEIGWRYILVPGKGTTSPLISPHLEYRWQSPDEAQ
jgi:hypothetical protein